MLSKELPLALVGCDFRIAPSAQRSRLVLADKKIQEILHALKKHYHVEGMVVLNTCNRNEWLAATSMPSFVAELLKAQMKALLSSEVEPYVYTGEDALRHILRVAIGQESLVSGERQIAGQIFKAFDSARQQQMSNRALNGLGSTIGRMVRLAVRKKVLAQSSSGVHALAAHYIYRNFNHIVLPQKIKIAVIGLGVIGKRVVGLLQQEPKIELILVNRTISPERVGKVRPFLEIGKVLQEVQGAVICTGASQAVITSIPVEARKSPLLLVDIGVPQQVDVSEEYPHVQVVGIDELVHFHQKEGSQEFEVDETIVTELIDQAVSEYQVFCSEGGLTQILDALKRNNNQLVYRELPKILQQRLEYIPSELQSKLAHDLRSIILDYNNDLFRTIKETIINQEGSSNGKSV